MALGVTWTMPDEDRYTTTKDQMVARIKHNMGGRAAEKLVLDYLSTGAANDLKQATEMAREMICSYGMSDILGPVSLGDGDHDVFLGRDIMSRNTYSEHTARLIDEEVKTMLETLYNEAFQLLSDNRATLDRITEALLERETLDRSELKLLMDGKPLPPMALPVADSPPAEPVDAEKPADFPGDPMPDPEPVPG
jgi:cell division protease FtsH